MYHVVLAAPGIYPFAPHGGLERYYYNLGKHLRSLGLEVEFVTSGPSLGSIVYNGVKYNFVISKKMIYNSTSSFGINVFRYRVFEFLSKRNSVFDILHTTYAAFPYVFKNSRRPVLAQCVGLAYLTLHELSRRVFVYLNTYLADKLSYELSDAIAVEGINQARELAELFKLDLSEKRVYIIPNGVDLEYISIFRMEILDRKVYGFSEEDFILIAISRLVANKGIEVLIKALKKVIDSGVNAKLILIGSGPKIRDIMKLAFKLGVRDRVFHYENVEEKVKYELLSISDVFVMPSLYEGMPTVILEAMAMAKPVIATRIDDVDQLIKDGVNGYLVKPGDPEALAEKIVKVYDSDSIKIMGLNSLNIVEKFDWREIASRVVHYYREILE